MSTYRLADLSINYYLRDLLYNNNYAHGKFSVVDYYPETPSSLTIFPTIAIESNYLGGISYQLGSTDKGEISYIIDIFAKSDGQADDIGYLIWSQFNNNNIPLYNFNSAFPATGVYNTYTGITQIGILSLERPILRTIPSPQTTVEEEKEHHRMITIRANVDIY